MPSDPGYWDGQEWTRPLRPMKRMVDKYRGVYKVRLPTGVGKWRVHGEGETRILTMDFPEFFDGHQHPGFYIPPVDMDDVDDGVIFEDGDEEIVGEPTTEYFAGETPWWTQMGPWAYNSGVMDWLGSKLQVPKEELEMAISTLNEQMQTLDTEAPPPAGMPAHLAKLMDKENEKKKKKGNGKEKEKKKESPTKAKKDVKLHTVQIG